MSAAATAVGGSGAGSSYGAYGWGYDKLDNAKPINYPAVGATPAYQDSPSYNVLNQQTQNAWWQNFSYDATGNMTAINNGITLVYDGRNRVASSTAGGITTNYWVNGLCQRVRKTWNGTLTASHVLFTFAPDGKHIGSYTLTGGLTEETIFLGDTPIATVTGAGTFNLYADHINAIRQVTNQTNQTRWSWEQTNAFGSTLPNQNPSGLGTFNYRRGFPGQFYDAELLTWNNGFRTYHAGLGRYLQPDPIGLAAGDPGIYTYVGNNPVLGTDVLGLNVYPHDFIGPIQPRDSYDPAPPPPGVLVPLVYSGQNGQDELLSRSELEARMSAVGLTDAQKAHLDRGCIGLASDYQGQGQEYPENAPKTSCFSTQAQAEAYARKTCPTNAFIFAKQGDWNGAAPAPGSAGQVPNNSIGDGWIGFNYITDFQNGTYAWINHTVHEPGAQHAYISPQPAALNRAHPHEIWCVTCSQ